MTKQEKCDQIIQELKEGRIYTIASPRCEDYYWYKDGKFHTSFEDGLSDSTDKCISEERVASEILRALAQPEYWEVCPDFGT